MRRNWSNRNVDLNKLKEKIAGFFNDNDFDVAINETQGGYQLVATGSPNYNVGGQILVTIEGKPDEFSIEIELQKKKPSRLLMSPILATLLGGGYFFSQNLKSQEAWIEFKRTFWQDMDKIITDLSLSQANQ